MNFDPYVAVLYQFETDFARIHLRREIESEQGTTVLVLFLRNSVPRVAIILTRLRKQTKITSNKTIVGKIRLQRFGRDLNSVPVNRHEIDVVVLEMKRRFGYDTVVCVVVHHTDCQRWAERNLKRKAQLPQLAQLRKLRCAFILF